MNQAFFSLFDIDPKRPWYCRKYGIFLLYDYVHLLKCIRNNWLTEKNGELKYSLNGKEMIAKWSDLVLLYELEKNSLVTLSRLNHTAVHPKPVERQRVPTCLRVFCEETIAAFESHEGIDKKAVEGTVTFLKMCVEFWKIVNVHQVGIDVRLRDELRAVMRSPDDWRLKYLLKLADIVEGMKKKGKGKRCQCLTPDTSKAFAHTCRGLVDLTKTLLQREEQDFVMLGDYTTDPIEGEFNGLRQGSGGAHFITVQQIVEKIRIEKAQLLLNFDIEVPKLDAGHTCTFCERSLNEKEIEILDNLEVLEISISDSVMSSIVYIAGYVVRDCKERNDEDTYEYYNNFGTYLKALNRGGLHIPNDSVVQWAAFSYLLFMAVEDACCINLLIKLFIEVAERYQFKFEKKHCRRLGNTFLKNSVLLKSPLSQKETSLRVLKLSS